jgi:hypothetical protein
VPFVVKSEASVTAILLGPHNWSIEIPAGASTAGLADLLCGL